MTQLQDQLDEITTNTRKLAQPERKAVTDSEEALAAVLAAVGF